MGKRSEEKMRADLVAACTEQQGMQREYQDRWQKGSAELQKEAERVAFRDKLIAEYERRKEALDAQISALVPELAVRPGEHKRVVLDVWVSSFSTQGYGAGMYAKAKAELIAEEAAGHGIETEVIPKKDESPPIPGVPRSNDPVAYQAVAYVKDESDAWLLGLKPLWDLREAVKRAWAKGVNPRVFNPYIPHGFEQENGLDYQGNDLERT